MSQKKVYIAKSGEYYKIGISDNPPERIKQLNTASPERIQLVSEYKSVNAVAAEKRLHKSLRHYRKNGEWFALTPKMFNLLMCVSADMDIDMISIWLKNISPFELMAMASVLGEKSC